MHRAYAVRALQEDLWSSDRTLPLLKEMSMLIRTVSTAALVGAAFLVPVSLPVVISAAVLLVLGPLSIVFWSLLRKDGTQARLRLGQWYEFSLDARDSARKMRRNSESKHASKADEPASKP